MRAQATRAVRPALIPWIIALVLSLAAGYFTSDQSWKELREASGDARLSQSGEDVEGPGLSPTTPVKLPLIAWSVSGLPHPVACWNWVNNGGGLWIRQSGLGLAQGRAPPAPGAA